ncbi:proton myo-inositol cotransporter-like [Stylophora pistillata]|uniref:proton myo-inositol cotransporter-like n=1 Tax=Stylophora pistillata TaxID=50429 RepID=UPI000C05511C|nr:proton myo-inositol cotransporter-like [Stylophora pistillata]
MESSSEAKQRIPVRLYFFTVFASIGGFLVGYNFSIVSGAMILIREEFHLSSFWQELIVSVAIGTAIIGASLGGFLNQRLGRKPMLLACALVFTIGAVVEAIAASRNGLLVGRLIVGLGIGGVSITAPVFISEIAPWRIRGRLVTVYCVFFVGAELVAAIIDVIFSPYKKTGWRFMFGLAAVPSSIMFLGCLWLPESPSWLVSRGACEDAREVLVRLRGTTDVNEELQSILAVCKERESYDKKSRFHKILTTSSTRKALLVGCMLISMQELSGINVVMFYSTTIIQMSGVQEDQLALWLAVVVYFTGFAFTFVGLYLVEKLGRRKLLLGSLAGVILCLSLLGGAFYLAKQHDAAITFIERVPSNISNSCPDTGYCLDCLGVGEKCGFCYAKDSANNPMSGSCVPINVSSNVNMAAFGRCGRNDHTVTWSYQACPFQYAWLATVALVLYIAAIAPGMGPLPWTINSEIYPLWARSTAYGFASAVKWTCNGLLSMTFLSLTEWITSFGVFWLYGGISLLGWLFFYAYLPETKDKSPEELEYLFS